MKHKHGIVCMHRCLNKFTCKRKGSKRCRVAEEAARQPAVCTRQAVLLRSLQSSEETWAQLAAATEECEGMREMRLRGTIYWVKRSCSAAAKAAAATKKAWSQASSTSLLFMWGEGKKKELYRCKSLLHVRNREDLVRS